MKTLAIPGYKLPEWVPFGVDYKNLLNSLLALIDFFVDTLGFLI